MSDSAFGGVVRPFRAGDQAAIARIKLEAIAHNELPGEKADAVAHWAESLTVASSGTLVAERNGEVLGFLSPNEHQVVVARSARRRGIGRALVALAERMPEANSAPLLLWLPPGNPAAASFFDSQDYVYYASLFAMTLSPEQTTPAPSFPDDLIPTDWASVDIPEFVRVFNAAFRDHPTPLQIRRELVEWSVAQPGNEKFAYLLLRLRATGELLGFARARLMRSDDGASGEVDFIGLLPEWRGRGSGRNLLLWAVAILRARGAGMVTLHVEAENDRALNLYKSTGFTTSHEWRRFIRSSGRARS